MCQRVAAEVLGVPCASLASARSRAEVEVGGGCLRLDREDEPDHADQRDNRRGSDDGPGLAANEVAPLVEEGVDAVLDSLAERARARHPRAGLPAHLSAFAFAFAPRVRLHTIVAGLARGAFSETLLRTCTAGRRARYSPRRHARRRPWHREHISLLTALSQTTRTKLTRTDYSTTRCHESAERTQHVHTPNGARAALLLCGVRTRDVVCRVCVSVCVVRGVCLCHLVSVSVSKSNHLLPPWRWLKRKHTYDMEHVQARPLKVR